MLPDFCGKVIMTVFTFTPLRTSFVLYMRLQDINLRIEEKGIKLKNLLYRVEKSREHGEHAPGTPKAFPRNKQGKKLSKRCSDSVSSHVICEKSLIY